MENDFKKFFISTLIISILVSSLVGGAMGFWAGSGGLSIARSLMTGGQNNSVSTNSSGQKMTIYDEESAVINAVDKVSPAVVSIIVSKDLPKIDPNSFQPFGSDFFRQFFGDSFNFGPSVPQNTPNSGGTQKTEIGGGSGFIMTSDGIIITNKHVVSDEEADYTVLMNNEKKYPAKVLARDTVNDLAVLKIEEKNLPTVELGDSSKLKVGQNVIAIGNALGEFRNTVSTGVVSGLSRSITAGDAGFGSENLTGVIQTDASINPGNSGGPLLNIAGQVIGINTAIAQGAQNIGFAIPINEVKSSIDSVRKTGKISRPWLGVRYALINPDIAKANNLSVDYGALIVRGDLKTDMAVIPGSPADKAGLVENDIILEINGQKVTEQNPLVNLLSKFKAGDQIVLKVLDKGKTKDIKVKLEEAK
jgi:serine protease Do